MKSLGAAGRTPNGMPPAARMAALRWVAMPSRWLKHEESSDEVLITAILGFSMSASDNPSAFHWARRTAQRDVPTSKLLRSVRRVIASWLPLLASRPAWPKSLRARSRFAPKANPFPDRWKARGKQEESKTGRWKTL